MGITQAAVSQAPQRPVFSGLLVHLVPYVWRMRQSAIQKVSDAIRGLLTSPTKYIVLGPGGKKKTPKLFMLPRGFSSLNRCYCSSAIRERDRKSVV